MSGRRVRTGIGVAIAVAALGAVAAGPAAAGPGDPQPGAPGLGDPFFPQAGNGGYDVRNYRLEVSYDPTTKRLRRDGRRSARAPMQALSRFNLDLRGFFDRGRGDGRWCSRRGGARRPGADDHPGPAAAGGPGVRRDRPVLGHARARRRPGRLHRGMDPHGRRSVRGRRAAGRAGLVPGQRQPPRQGDVRHPRDRPRGGDGGRRTAAWCPRAPGRGTHHMVLAGGRAMAPYLATATLGTFSLTTSDVDGIPSYVAVDPSQEAAAAPALAKLPDILRYFTGLYRPVPVRHRRRDRGRRPRGRLRAGDADAAGVRPGARRGDAGARAGAPVVRRLRVADGVARHLAQRGLRDLRRVAVAASTPARRRRRPGSTRCTRRPPRTRSGPSRRPAWAAPPTCSPARSTSAAP